MYPKWAQNTKRMAFQVVGNMPYLFACVTVMSKIYMQNFMKNYRVILKRNRKIPKMSKN